ncbi:alpha-hydroxy acid oxidase [Blastococcus saxobsidens]|uniref:alpha-hydroxy acid oxidase n=1 Tax=Blastococcus saxobsidens TaxID=138336 RepID=UPI0013150FB0|nr:alpha-hydroxy acid oxidase [Blastococcus saxobsidens]
MTQKTLGRAADLLTIPEVVERARQTLSGDQWDYSCGGAESETTLRRNRTAFAELAFRPRVLMGAGQPDTSATFLGRLLALPVLLAPVGSIATFHPDGALACARVAADAGTGAFVGTLSHPALEVVRSGSTAPLFFQLYVYGDRGWLRDLVSRVEAAGYQGICVTVDVSAYGRRERDLHNRYFPRQSVERPNLGASTDVPGMVHRDAYNAALTWDDLAWLRGVTRLPLIVKGIMSSDDAAIAADHGVDVVYVSNHGGRQLDHALASIDVLPEVVSAVDGRAEVVLDSGIMRGSDVVKALALGARAVAIGKLMAWGLSAGGEAGLLRTLQLLQTEMATTLTNLGVRSVSELHPDLLRRVSPSAASAWPADL